MSVAIRRDRRMRVAEFIEMIRPLPDEERWELLDGQPILMAPQSERHQRIVGNLLDALRRIARPRGCVALPGLGLLNDFVDDYAPIPDAVVRCGPMLPDGYARDPIILAEVLSPSTMSNDRGRKSEFYKSLQTLRTFLLIYQDEFRVEAWQKEDAEWRFRAFGREGLIPLPELEGSLAVADLYADVPLPDAD